MYENGTYENDQKRKREPAAAAPAMTPLVRLMAPYAKALSYSTPHNLGLVEHL